MTATYNQKVLLAFFLCSAFSLNMRVLSAHETGLRLSLQVDSQSLTEGLWHAGPQCTLVLPFGAKLMLTCTGLSSLLTCLGTVLTRAQKDAQSQCLQRWRRSSRSHNNMWYHLSISGIPSISSCTGTPLIVLLVCLRNKNPSTKMAAGVLHNVLPRKPHPHTEHRTLTHRHTPPKATPKTHNKRI